MKIVPLAFDSMGTRSMATYVETKDIKILIDPSVSIAPKRFGLMPHPKEVSRMGAQWASIAKHAKKAQVLVVSHYHYDHYKPENPEIFKGKVALLKDPSKDTNQSQHDRAGEFLPKIRGIVKDMQYVDGREFKFGKTRVAFSEPVYHGIDDRLGYVVETLVDDGKERFVHTSDVEGPSRDEQLKFIMESMPTTVFLDGPLSYIIYKFGHRALESSMQNMMYMIEDTDIKKLVVDHHFLRDPQYMERIENVVKRGTEHGCKVFTAAEFKNKKVEMLESMRRELYGKK